MWDQIKASFEESLRRIATAVAAFLPRVIAFLAIMVLALVLAGLVRVLVRRLLAGVRFDERVQRWGFTATSEWAPAQSPSLLLARLGFWLALLGGFLLGLTVFDAAAASALALGVLGYLPQICAAAAIFLVGLLIARFLERNVLVSAVNMQIHSARLLSLGVKWLVVVLAAAMALQHLGIGGSLVTISFSILFGGIVLALSLAVGLGSREMVSKTLEKQIRKEKKPEVENEISHM